ncbi:hypothetical protein ACX80W_10955 [Arthrobacter sp. TMN-37]
MDLDQCVELFTANIEDIRAIGSDVHTIGLISPDTSRTMPLLGAYFGYDPALELKTRLTNVCRQLAVPRVHQWNYFDHHRDQLIDGLHPDSGGHQAIYHAVSQNLN